MPIIVKIAWRNLWRHKGKSLIVGTILFLGATVMTVGTAVTTGMDRGLRKNIVQGFTGDLVLMSKKNRSSNVFLNAMGAAVEPLPDYTAIKELLAEEESVGSFMPIGKGLAMVLNEAGGPMDGAFVLGVDMKQYTSFFPDNLRLLQGAWPASGEEGVLLATGAQKMFTTSMGIFFMPESTDVDTSIMPANAREIIDQLTIKRTMVFMGFSDDNTSTDVRLPVRGLVKYRSLNTIWGVFILMDIESFRRCMGYVSAAYGSVEIPEENEALLAGDTDEMDELFAEDNLLVDNRRESPSAVYRSEDSTEGHEIDIDAGTWNLVLVKLGGGATGGEAAARLNGLFEKRGMNVRAVEWHEAIGTIGSMAMLIKTALFVFVMLLFFVAIVIIINTLTMTALERTPEIGMMRAIGARKGFIGSMFAAETSLLASFFGAIGIGAGWVLVTVLRLMKITTDNDMIQLLYGGDRFAPYLTPGDLGLAVLQLALVAAIAVVYPLIVARNITPLDAVTRE